jgi:Protein of unknown function (DUF3300)
VRQSGRLQRNILKMLFVVFVIGGVPGIIPAQGPPSYPPRELDNMVSRIALYPDPLIAQILAAATFPDQIQDAARWADEHHYLRGDDLAQAITADQLPWDPSVQSLLPFPSVLEMMASDMDWTAAIGNAFLSQQEDVMEAVQRERRKARDYGYLRSNAQVVVSGGPYITIMPANPGYVCVPAYDPRVVFAAPRAGFYVGGAIGFGFGIALGAAFRPWGWGVSHFEWNRHEMYVGDARWGRNWGNRAHYTHPYYRPYYHDYHGGEQHWNRPRPEEHQRIVRDQEERNAARRGYARPNEQHDFHRQAPHHDAPHHDAPRHDSHHDDHGRH